MVFKWNPFTSNFDDAGVGGAGDVVGPGLSVIGDIATWADITGTELADSGVSFSTDGTLAANSDALVSTQKAVKTYADTKQPLDANLTSISLLGTAADKIAYTTGIETWAETTLTAYMRTLLDDPDATTARATLGVTPGSDVQPYSAALTSIAALVTVANEMIYTTAADTYATTVLTPYMRTLLDDPTAATAIATLGFGAASSTGTILRANGTNWVATTATYPATTAQGDILSSTSANTIVALAKNTNATRYLANTGANNNSAWDQVNLANGVTGTLPITNGGTGVTTIPAFSAYLNTTATNVTGDATQYNIAFDTVLFDTTSSFNTGTGRFVCPRAGKYLFSVGIRLNDLTTAWNYVEARWVIDGSATNYFIWLSNAIPTGATSPNFLFISNTVILDLALNQTVGAETTVAGSTKSIDVQGFSTTPATWIAGHFITT